MEVHPLRKEKRLEDKNAFREKLEAQLKEWNAKIELLKSKAENARADARIEYSEDMEKLKARRDALKSKLAQLQSAGGEALESARKGAEKAAADLKNALDRAMSRFK